MKAFSEFYENQQMFVFLGIVFDLLLLGKPNYNHFSIFGSHYIDLFKANKFYPLDL